MKEKENIVYLLNKITQQMKFHLARQLQDCIFDDGAMERYSGSARTRNPWTKVIVARRLQQGENNDDSHDVYEPLKG